jgi:hypothetical protein
LTTRVSTSCDSRWQAQPIGTARACRTAGTGPLGRRSQGREKRPWPHPIDASHICQTLKLNLRPWECWPPCAVAVGETDAPGLEHRGISKSAALLRKMLSLGISRWHPDPLKAIEQAGRERVA